MNHSPNRRQFMALGSIGSIGLSMEARAERRSSATTREGVEAVLDDLDERRAIFRQRFRRAREALGRSPDVSAQDEAMLELTEGMLVYNTFLDQPLKAQIYPKMQQQIQEAFAKILQAIPKLRSMLREDEHVLPFETLDRAADLDRQDLFTLLDDADFRLGRFRTSLLGRRRVGRLMHRALLDVQAEGSKATLQRYLEDALNIQSAAPPSAEVPAHTRAAVLQAKQEWIAEGVAPEAFERDDRAMRRRVFGGILIFCGSYMFIAGLATIAECLCTAVAGMALGALLIALGFLLIKSSGVEELNDRGPLRLFEVPLGAG